MKKIILSIAAIATVVAIAGVASWAAWSDTETSNNNKITADKLDLVLADVPLSISDVVPGEEGLMGTAKAMNNSNTVDGEVSISLDSLIDYEHGCVEPEKNEGNDTTCGTTEGELSSNTWVYFVIHDQTGDYTTPEILLSNLVAGTEMPLGTLNAGDTATVEVHYRINNSGTPFEDNIFMTDEARMNVKVILTQS